MANSKLPPKNNQSALNDSVQQFLQAALHPTKSSKLLLAYSGGLDSAVLLHILADARQYLDFSLSVMHVHHGLSPNADDWADFCLAQCEKLEVPCEIMRVSVDTQSGLGVEAAARKARYQALASAQADWICLAHHQNDQAETVLLQLARGAGVKGLSGMAAIDQNKGLLRPLLMQTRAELEAYASTHQITWVEDESNQQLDFKRNVIRHKVLPVLQEYYPAVTSTISRSASHQAEANELLNDLAQIDAEKVLPRSQNTDKLNLTALKQLSPARAKNVLRYWLASSQILLPSTVHLEQLYRQLKSAKADNAMTVKVAENLFVRVYQNQASLTPEMTEPKAYAVQWQGESSLEVVEGLALRFDEKMGQGLSLAKLKNKQLLIKNRSGGEKLRPYDNRPAKTVKQLMQISGVPPWQRHLWPLVYVDDAFACMPEIAVDHRFKADTNEVGLMISLELPYTRSVELK